ncbi:MAG: hypothetical protein QM742_17445 [Aquabacterium sp.]
MQRFLRSTLAIASLATACGTALASTLPITVEAGQPIAGPGYGSATPFEARIDYQASEVLTSTLSLISGGSSGIQPAEVVSTGYPFFIESMAMSAPYTRMGARLDEASGAAPLTYASFAGGMQITAAGRLPNGKRNPTTTGGSLTLTNFTVSFDTRTVYADLTGANGVGTRSKMLLWNYSSITETPAFHFSYCPLSPQEPCTVSMRPTTLSGLTTTWEAQELISTSLGLTNFGKTAWAGIDDYGSLTISAVPEAGAGWLSVAGLLVLAGLKRRAKAAAPARS